MIDELIHIVDTADEFQILVKDVRFSQIVSLCSFVQAWFLFLTVKLILL